MNAMVVVRGTLLALLLSLVTAGCVKTQAKTVPEPPALEVPPAPPRVVQPLRPDDVVTAEPPESGEVTETPPSRPRSRPANRPDAAGKAEPSKGDGKPETAPGDPAKATAPPDAARTGTIEPALPGGETEAARGIRAQMARADALLNKVKYDRLTADGKSQFDAARRFIVQAEEALKERNYAYAAKLAETAASLAALLPGG